MASTNLMRDDPDTRAFYQARFEHVFVDEFQDTDPLQAEIVLYLAERGRAAASDDTRPPPRQGAPQGEHGSPALEQRDDGGH